MKNLIIFDFDGVIADSEAPANAVLAEMVTELGVSTTVEDSYRLYMGKRFHEVIAAVEAQLGHPLPTDFGVQLQVRTLARFQHDLRPIEGVHDYMGAFAHVPRCIASSSSPDRLAACLEILGLQSAFGRYVFSASTVPRGKPHPDLFLHAAAQMNVEASRAMVIEDSPSGVQAGVAAGMTVIGLLAASHIGLGHERVLKQAGAHYVARTFQEVDMITRNLLGAAPIKAH